MHEEEDELRNGRKLFGAFIATRTVGRLAAAHFALRISTRRFASCADIIVPTYLGYMSRVPPARHCLPLWIKLIRALCTLRE